ncbi:MAG: glycosyltransferase family 4 protein [Patescibacteria group bacterium]|nr:glycosyltransferase family 4 protein [Patescibacteria group bacterium]
MKVLVVNNFSPKEVIGGSEVQCWLIAKYLAKRGHLTAYLALEGLSAREEEGEGFKVYYLSKRGENKLKAFINFYKLLKKEKPDICYIRIFRYLFFLTKIAQFLKIPVVFNTSHINDCKPSLEKIKFSLNPFEFFKSIKTVIFRRLNFSTLKKVNVITLNQTQVELLKEKYNISATPIYDSMEDKYEKNRRIKEKQIVWVNNIKPRKRPEIFIDLANCFKGSDHKFLMIGNFQTDDPFYSQLIAKCEKENPNFKYLGGKSVDEVDKILAGSEILVNTCEIEGFGDNLIQAWFNECPAIALSFDPDDIIKRNNIGFHSGSFEKMVGDLRFLMQNSELREEMGKRAREYALKNHEINANITKFIIYFSNILEYRNLKNSDSR